MTSQGPLSTQPGAPVAGDRNGGSAGVAGPVPVKDRLLLGMPAHFNSECVPERIVHARGAAAHGTLILTRRVRRWTRAAFPQVSRDQVSRDGIAERAVNTFRQTDGDFGKRLEAAVQALCG